MIPTSHPSPEEMARLTARMLLEIFGVREEKRRPPVVSCMGRGYDIIHDEIKVSKKLTAHTLGPNGMPRGTLFKNAPNRFT